MSSTNDRNTLAVLGGPRLFDRQLHVGRPNLPDRNRLTDRIGEVFDALWFTNAGPMVQEFERRCAELLGVRHFIAMCNGTVALEIAIRALGLEGEVLLPSNTFVATAHALQWQEITPVFCDIDPTTHNIDPARAEGMITPRTTGILGVHVWGRPCPVEALREIADRRGLKLLFDASHAFGCSHQGRMVGNFGECETFSFHATKFINTFEGGAVTTNNDQLAEKIRLMKNFGFAGYDNVIYIGTNGKMNEVSAAMGLSSLESMAEFVAVNRRNYECYRDSLGSVAGLQLIRFDEDEVNNYQYVVVEVDAETFGLDRDELVRVFHAENVLARRYFWPGCHRMEPYRSLFPHAGLLLENTESILKRILVLPTGTSVSTDDISKICGILSTAVTLASEVRRALEEA